MPDLYEQIAQMGSAELDSLLNAVLQRYEALFPDWEISTVSVQKSVDRNERVS